MSRPKQIDDNTCRQMADLWSYGFTQREISEMCGVHESSVQRLVKESGCSRTPPVNLRRLQMVDLRNYGFLLREVAVMYDVSVERVRQVLGGYSYVPTRKAMENTPNPFYGPVSVPLREAISKPARKTRKKRF